MKDETLPAPDRSLGAARAPYCWRGSGRDDSSPFGSNIHAFAVEVSWFANFSGSR